MASSCFGFDRAHNFEDPHSNTQAWHPYLACLPGHDEIVVLNNAQTKLFNARKKRILSGREDKILTSWNALAIKGLARAGRVFNRPDWIVLAQNALDFIRDKMWVNDALFCYL